MNKKGEKLDNKLWTKNLSLKINIFPLQKKTKQKRDRKLNFVVFVRVFSEVLRNVGEILVFSGHAVHRITRPLMKTLWSSSHWLVGCCGEWDNSVHPLEENTRFEGPSLGGVSSQMNQLQFVFSLGHIVVLVGVFLVTLHVVSVNKRLYPLLQVSRLKGKKPTGVNTWKYSRAVFVLWNGLKIISMLPQRKVPLSVIILQI